MSEHDLTGESESVVGTPSTLITSRSLAERANSPSVASVTSGEKISFYFSLHSI